MQENFNILHFYWDAVLFFKSREDDYLLLKYKIIFSYRERHSNEAPIWGGVHFNKVNQEKFLECFPKSLLRFLGILPSNFQNETTSHAITEFCEQNTSFCSRIIFSAFNLYYIILSYNCVVLAYASSFSSICDPFWNAYIHQASSRTLDMCERHFWGHPW